MEWSPVTVSSAKMFILDSRLAAMLEGVVSRNTSERGVNSVAMAVINLMKGIGRARNSNQRPPCPKSFMQSTVLPGMDTLEKVCKKYNEKIIGLISAENIVVKLKKQKKNKSTGYQQLVLFSPSFQNL